MRLLLIAAALAVALVPGASAQPPKGRFFFFGPAVISPNGNGINDALHVKTNGPSDLHVYGWGGRLHGWHEIATGADWAALHDGTYQVTACLKDRGRRLPVVIPPAEQRPGAAEETVSRPPWRWSGCLAKPRVIRVERLAAYVDSAKSYTPGSRPPLVVSADRG